MPRTKTPLTEVERSRRKSIWLLFAFAIFVPELISGSTPPTSFFPFGIIYIFVYGIPMLLIRDLAVRYKIGTAGLICFGLAYGIVNEGLFAKTMLWGVHDLPIKEFNHIGRFLGINFGWAAFICAWHALASTLFPITFVELFYPKTAEEPWLKPEWTWVLLAVDVVVASAFFLGVPIFATGTPAMLALLFGLMAGLFALGFFVRGNRPIQAGQWSVKTIWLGFSGFFPFIGLCILAGGHINFWVLLILLVGVFFLYQKALGSRSFERKTFACFALGFYLYTGLFAALAWFTKSIPVAIIGAVVNFAICYFLARRLLKVPDQEPSIPQDFGADGRGLVLGNQISTRSSAPL